MDGRAVRGVLLAASGALAYGLTILFGRSLARDAVGAPTALGVRFGIASVVLLLVLAAAGRSLAPPAGERLTAALLGTVGYAVESSFFYMGLERGTAAAVALLFYAYPAVVTVLDVATGGPRPRALTVAALGLSVAGTALVAASADEVSISTAGIVFSLASAATFSLYLLASHRLATRSDARVLAAWVAGGASCSFLVRGVVFGQLDSPAGHWPELIANGVATAAAFSLTFAALRRLGPSPTAVVMTLEAFFAIVLGALFLDETIGVVQVAGGIAILAGAALIGLSRPRVPAYEATPGAERP